MVYQILLESPEFCRR